MSTPGAQARLRSLTATSAILFRPCGFSPLRRLSPREALECFATRDGHGVWCVSSFVFRTAEPQAAHRCGEHEAILASGFIPPEESPLPVAAPHHCGRYPLAVGSTLAAFRRTRQHARKQACSHVNSSGRRSHRQRAQAPHPSVPCPSKSTDTQAHRAHAPKCMGPPKRPPCSQDVQDVPQPGPT